MKPTHYQSSKGPIAIEAMNEFHLHNAIKKHERNGGDAELLDALKAEQLRRGGPPSETR